MVIDNHHQTVELEIDDLLNYNFTSNIFFYLVQLAQVVACQSLLDLEE
jgi:hypothetical protein